MKKIVTLLSTLVSTSCFATVELTALPNSVVALVPVDFNAASTFTLNVTNDTDKTSSYSYSAMLCPERVKCTSKTKTFSVAPRGRYTETFQLLTNVMYRKPGYLQNVATITLAGTERSHKREVGHFDLR